MRRVIILAACLPLLLPAAARADELGDALGEVTKAYKAGDFGALRASLQDALQLLGQRAAANLAAALPEPLAGWKAEAAETSSGGALGMLGGGTQASRQYSNAQGQSVKIEVTADSPVVAQLGMLLTNPAMMGAMGKLIRIGSQRAVQTNDNEIQMLLDNRILVGITGDAPVEAKLAYARAIDLTKVAAVR
jgi:hypothetical protein